jgi:hypothetical protein
MMSLLFRVFLVSLLLVAFLEAADFEKPNLGLVVARPTSAPGLLDNPLKGYCLYTDAGKIHRPYSMVFQYVSWKELEPIEGRYAFEAWEKRKWSHPRANGKHVVLRVYVDYPEKPSGLPDWLRAKGVTEKAYRAHGGGKSPDYNHPQMVVALERLIAAMGKRYNTHPRVAFIQLGLLGFWGEWHTYPREELFASEATQHRVLRAYLKAFPNKQLMARYADGTLANYHTIGFHDDMFPEDTDNGKDWSFLARMRRSGHIDSWKQTVVGGEMVPNAARKWLGKRWDLTRAMVGRSHFSWVGPYGPALEAKASGDFIARSDQLVRQMGYQFRLTEIRHSRSVTPGAQCKVILQGVNEGVAPFYYPWPLKLAWLDVRGTVLSSVKLEDDIRKWLPGKFEVEATLPAPAKPGTYQLGFGIEDPWMKKPAIRLANKLPLIEGWTVLGKVQVKSKLK